MKKLIDFKLLKQSRSKELNNVSEVIQRTKFVQELSTGKLANYRGLYGPRQHQGEIPSETLKAVIDSGMLTFLLHCEARMASFVGQGFYTIGPCGEELMAAVGANLRASDPTALHYRHLAMSVYRQLSAARTMEEIALDRARGYTCSERDPVTGGRHCAIGGSPNDFLVTSTLASQTPPAVGRALAIPLSNHLLKHPVFPADSVSFVSVGDGSVNNAHFLSGINFATYLQHRKYKCPVVFAVSDNDRCISLPGHGYLSAFVDKLGMQSFRCNGSDVDDLYIASQKAIGYSRQLSRPSLLLIQNVPRRFGHAATDRQFAYLSAEAIQAQADRNPLAAACATAVDRKIVTEEELLYRFSELQTIVENAFELAVNEPKITDVSALAASNSQPLTHSVSSWVTKDESAGLKHSSLSNNTNGKTASGAVAIPDAMRKHMTRVYDEILTSQPDSVYLGEDVTHGGYYLVTDGLAAKHKGRVLDFPPDETSLVGAAMGFAQAGLLPILEIPYAKYLDCAGDMFSELCILNWLNNANANPSATTKCGVFVRLQGFDRGVFGGNYHTHNMLNVLYPGLDVICYSNGYDYARGVRYAMKQVRNGRVVMCVDSTDLLNKRHLVDGDSDGYYLSIYPENSEEELAFDTVSVYEHRGSSGSSDGKTRRSVCVVSYGNGVGTAKQARALLADRDIDLVVVDCPYLSGPPKGLVAYLQQSGSKFDLVVFADVCKEQSSMPLLGIANAIANANNGSITGASPTPYSVIGAANTYNPLGNVCTFLSPQQIAAHVRTRLGL